MPWHEPRILAGLLALVGAAVARGAGLPDPAPPFQASVSRRQAVLLKCHDVVAGSNRVRESRTVESPSLSSGNKGVGFRSHLFDSDEACELFVDGKPVGIGKFFYVEPKPGSLATLEIDQQAGTLTSRMVSADDVGYSYTLRPLGDGRIAVEWETTRGGLSFCFFLRGACYRDAGVACNGKTVALLPLEALSPSQKLLQEVQGPARIEIAPGRPLESIALEAGDGVSVSLMENRQQDPCLWIWLRSPAAQGSFTLDLGATAVTEGMVPPPVAGVDFWASDRTHVPAPTTRNLKPNPSFEQGLRYWTWWYGGGKFVPTALPAYSITSNALLGANALLVRNAGGGMAMMSFPIPVEKGANYTVSFHAKAERNNTLFGLGVQSALRNDGSKMGWQEGFKYRHMLTNAWKRYAFSFKSDTAAVALLLAPGGSPVWVDAIQVEKGATVSDYTGPEVEGFLRTSDPDGLIAVGQRIDAHFELSGKPGTVGDVELSVFDYYRERRFRQTYPFALSPAGNAALTLPFDALNLGSGVFIVRADFHPKGRAPHTDYYRFSILDFLENTHATKNLFGNLLDLRHTRADDLARNFRRWGWGATSYNFNEQVAAQYRIDNFCETIYSHLTPEQRADYFDAIGKWTLFTPERVRRIEEICADVVRRNPAVPVWAPTCEIEGVTPLVIAGNFDEWAKFQTAAYRGIKRANPQALVLPDTGTSGLNRMRGFREQEGYLRSTQGQARWDAMAAHPYGSLDNTCGNNDLDANTAQFIDLMAKYGYGPETPIYYTEGFNLTDTRIPEWGSGGAYDHYGAGRPSYDTGWREFIQAAWIARTYLTCLKYWPQVQTFNIWVSAPCLDQYFAPLYACHVPNTLGHLLGNPRYQSDIRPAGGVRGYAFEDEQGRGLVALWCAMEQVDNGMERGPELRVTFGRRQPEFIDLMGNHREVKAKAGVVTLQLTPAPLFLRSRKGGLKKLVQALDTAQVRGAGSALSLDVQPQRDGRLDVVLANQTGAALRGTLEVGALREPFDIPPRGTTHTLVPGDDGIAPGRLHTWKKGIAVAFSDAKKNEILWDLSYFYVPRVAQPLPLDPAAPAWQAIPAIPLTNGFVAASRAAPLTVAGGSRDLLARFQLAWDASHLYLRVSATDDHIVLTDPARWRDSQLYMHDGSLEVYLDTGANGRSNPGKGFDLDDYRYDFYAGDAAATNGAGSVYRLREAHHQLAGGLNMPTKADAAKGISCRYQRTADSYAYVMIFPQRFIEPLKLEAGWRAGFGLFLHDKESGQEWPLKGLSLATEAGSHCDNKPQVWPVMVLAE